MISEELQRRVFGHVDPEEPVPGSWKAEVCRLLETGLSEPEIETLAQAVKRKDQTIIQTIIAPRVSARLN